MSNIITFSVPFACSGGNFAGATACMLNPSVESVFTFESLTTAGAWVGNVDATSHMQHDRVYIFAGKDDTIIVPGITIF